MHIKKFELIKKLIILHLALFYSNINKTSIYDIPIPLNKKRKINLQIQYSF